MDNAYLWDKNSGTPDPFIVKLERVLARRRYRVRRPWAIRSLLALPLGLLAAGLVLSTALAPDRAEPTERAAVGPPVARETAAPDQNHDPAVALDEAALTDAAEPLALHAAR